jgi:hypothetical protein
MNVDDQLNQAGERLNTKLNRVAIPTPPKTMWPWWRPVLATAVLVLFVGGSLLWVSRSEGPGHDLAEGMSSTAPTQMQGSSTVADTLPACESLVLWPTAPEGSYRDEPVYTDIEAQEVAVEVERFASNLPGFESIWIDPAHNQWVTVGFVGVDVSERQVQLEEAYPGAGVVAVGMAYTSDELETLGADISSVLPDGMTVYRIYETAGYVGVWVGVVSPERITELATVANDRPVCWGGYNSDEVIPAGPQLASGDGWRYLAEFDRSMGRQSQVVATGTALGELWSELETAEPAPAVDFASEIVVAFEVGYSGNCAETRFDGIEISSDVVHLLVVDPSIGTGPPPSCQFDRQPRVYVIAVSRSQLPTPPFTIKTNRNGAADVVIVDDLRQPGSDIETSP